MPIGDGARLPGTAPSTNPDGLDLAVAEARAMSQEEFGRVFGLASLDDVTLVQPGFLERAPRGCEWYVRFRPAPKNPGPKDRKDGSYELVVKALRRAAPEAGGGMVVNPLRIGLEGKDPDAARLEALVYLARKSGRRRRATNWPIERIQSLRCSDLLEKYKAGYLSGPVAGETEDSGGRSVRMAKLSRIRAFQRAFPELEVGDVGDWIVKEYDRRAKDRAATSRCVDLFFVRLALQQALGLVGVPPTYHLHFRVPKQGRLPKVAWTPEEYDRVRAAAHGWLFLADGGPRMVSGADGPVQARRCWSVDVREAWRRAIEFLPYTASRHGRLTATRWLPPEAEPQDGRPLRDRPWIEVTEKAVVYHRDGEARYDGSKRRGPVIIPAEFAPAVRAWYAADLAAGFEFVFHRPDGSRYSGNYLDKDTFRRIVRDAGLAARRVPHHLKDLAVQWSDSAGIDRHTLAVHADTTVETLEQKYGDVMNLAKLLEAAEKMTQADWRALGVRRADVIKLFDNARGKNRPAPARRRRAGPQ
jgi:hypothetical protein